MSYSHIPDRPRIYLLLILLLMTGWFMLPESLREQAEPTAHAAAFTVTNTNDGGPGSLRQAILDANGSPGPDTINFNLPQPGVNTISPLSPLPVIIDPLVINGLTPDGKYQVELNGSGAGANADGLFVNDNFTAGGNVTIEGLIINRFGGCGIVLASTRLNRVEKNIIGTNAEMTADLGNGQHGILVNNSSSNVVTGNVIAANHASGVMLTGSGSTANFLTKNQIGVGSEAATLGNRTGVSIVGGANDNVIGVATAFDYVFLAPDSNNISYNTEDGLLIETRGNVVYSDRITKNGHDGVRIRNGSANKIGSADPYTRNVIAANQASGVELDGANENLVQGNRIGLDNPYLEFGTLPNKGDGVLIKGGASRNTIGGVPLHLVDYTDNPGNAIFNNGGAGVRVENGAGNLLVNNGIGYNSGAGVLIESGEGNSLTENGIYGNAGAGVFVNAPAGTGSNSTLITRDAFSENGGLSIDLAPAGATANDPGDADTGANGLQNFPLLSSVRGSEYGRTVYAGTLNSTPNSKFNLEFFASETCDETGRNVGNYYRTSYSVTTDGAGNASFDFSNTNARVQSRPGEYIVATATDASGNTSEFSPCVVDQESGLLSWDENPSPDFYHVNEGAGSITLKVRRALSTAGTITVDYQTLSGSALAGVDFVPVQGTLVFHAGESEKSVTVPILDDALVEYPEFFNVVLSNPTGGASFGPYLYPGESPSLYAEVGIMDNDTTPRIVYGLTTNNELVSFTTQEPGKLLSNRRINGDTLLGIDFRPATGELYGLGLSGHLYLVNRLTGDLKQVGPDAIPNLTETPTIAIDFDPVRDRLRVTISRDNRNLQLNPNTGAISSVDTPLTNGIGLPVLYGLAYSNNYPGATSTTAYGLNIFVTFVPLNLVTLGSPGGSPVSPDSGKLFSIADRFGPVAGAWAGFDIADTGEAYASTFTSESSSVMVLRRVNLEKHSTSSLGIIGDRTQVIRDITVEPAAPGTNLIDNPGFFVRQQYQDFLGREPDAGGLGYWTNQITLCGNDADCIRDRRVSVSAAFVIENEFQQTGSFVYRLYKGTLGRGPTYAEFAADRSKVEAGFAIEETRNALVAEFVTRQEFKTAYTDAISNADFVNKLFDTAGLSPYTSERAQLLTDMQGGKTRAQAVREVIEIQAFKDAEYNPSFVLMQYFGYLRRDPDQGGYDFWLGQVNRYPLRGVGIQQAMACSFITSVEYQTRFSSVVTHTNKECPQ